MYYDIRCWFMLPTLHEVLTGVILVISVLKSCLDLEDAGSQSFKVHPLSEGLPQVGPRCRNRTGAVTHPDETMVTCGFIALVRGVQQGRLRMTLRLYVEDAQRSVFAAAGCRSPRVISLQLLDDGREFGIQRRSAGFGPRGWAWSTSARVLLLLVWKGMMEGGRKRRSGGTDWRSVRLPVRGRGRGAALLVADGCGAGVVVGAWTWGGGFALGQNTLLHH